MHNRSIPMLEYLDPDYDRELASAPQGGQVAVNEAMTSLRYTFGQLPYRGVRNIEAHQVETGVHQGHSSGSYRTRRRGPQPR